MAVELHDELRILRRNREHYYLKCCNKIFCACPPKWKRFPKPKTLMEMCGLTLRRSFVPRSRKTLWTYLRSNPHPDIRPYLREELYARYEADYCSLTGLDAYDVPLVFKNMRLIISNIVNILDNDGCTNVLKDVNVVEMLKKLPFFLNDFFLNDPKDVYKFNSMFKPPVWFISEHIWTIYTKSKPSIAHEKLCKTEYKENPANLDEIFNIFPEFNCKVCCFAEVVISEWGRGRWFEVGDVPKSILNEYITKHEGIEQIGEEGGVSIVNLWTAVRYATRKKQYELSYFYKMLIANFYSEVYIKNYRDLEQRKEKIDPPLIYCDFLLDDLESLVLATGSVLAGGSCDYYSTVILNKLSKKSLYFNVELLGRDFACDTVYCAAGCVVFHRMFNNRFLISQCVWQIFGYPPINKRCTYSPTKKCVVAAFAGFVLDYWQIFDVYKPKNEVEKTYQATIAYKILNSGGKVNTIEYPKLEIEVYDIVRYTPDYLDNLMYWCERYAFHPLVHFFIHNKVIKSTFKLSCGCKRE